MTKRQYVLDTDDKRLIDETVHATANGSIRKLARAIERSEPYLRHILSGRVSGLDPATRDRLHHLLVVEQVRQRLIEALGDRWGVRTSAVIEHVLTCPSCLSAAVIASEKHFRDTVVAHQRHV